MNQKILIGVGASVTAMVFFVAGFYLGRNSPDNRLYYASMSTAETPLLGTWQVSSNIEPIESTIEFRRDRTAIKRIGNGPAMVAVWGRNGDEVSLQNAHNIGEQGGYYVPPAILNLLTIDDKKMHLVTPDGTMTWKLSRL
jgi:hypothetical protein